MIVSWRSRAGLVTVLGFLRKNKKIICIYAIFFVSLRPKLKKYIYMQVSERQNSSTSITGMPNDSQPRLTKAEIDSGFIDVETSRQSVLAMVRGFYSNQQEQ